VSELVAAIPCGPLFGRVRPTAAGLRSRRCNIPNGGLQGFVSYQEPPLARQPNGLYSSAFAGAGGGRPFIMGASGPVHYILNAQPTSPDQEAGPSRPQRKTNVPSY